MTEPDPPTETPAIPREKIPVALVASFTIMAGAGVLIIGWQQHDLRALFLGPLPWYWQLLLGAAIGAAAAPLMIFGAGRLPFLKPVRDLTREILLAFRPGVGIAAAAAITAGISEELLFRGALQPWIGLWWATAAFALAHGLTPRIDRGVALYVSVVFVLGLGLGALAGQAGLLAAMMAHAVYDFIALLLGMREYLRNEPAGPPESS